MIENRVTIKKIFSFILLIEFINGAFCKAEEPYSASLVIDPMQKVISTFREKNEKENEEKKEVRIKRIFLTFDDGPSKYTEKLLDVLKKYNIKATFFVTNQHPQYIHLLKRMSEEGHSIGIHSYKHEYKVIYQNCTSFFNDFKKMDDVIYNEIGERVKLVRFPGGSSSTISNRYNPGLMRQLIKTITKKEYQYFDWNIDSGDSKRGSTPYEIFYNILYGCESRENSIVLMHDVSYRCIETMEMMLPWFIMNNYSFHTLDKDSYFVHHHLPSTPKKNVVNKRK